MMMIAISTNLPQNRSSHSKPLRIYLSRSRLSAQWIWVKYSREISRQWLILRIFLQEIAQFLSVEYQHTQRNTKNWEILIGWFFLSSFFWLNYHQNYEYDHWISHGGRCNFEFSVSRGLSRKRKYSHDPQKSING